MVDLLYDIASRFKQASLSLSPVYTCTLPECCSLNHNPHGFCSLQAQCAPKGTNVFLTRHESSCDSVSETKRCEMLDCQAGWLVLCIRCTDVPDEQDPDLVGVGGPPPTLVGLWHSCSLATHPSLHFSCRVTHTASDIHITHTDIMIMYKRRQRTPTKGCQDIQVLNGHLDMDTL